MSDAMYKVLRRVLGLTLVGGAGFAGFAAWQRRNRAPAATVPQWPPFEPASANPPSANTANAAAASFADVPASSTPSSSDARWVAPVDGQCPAGYPIKANDNSGIYHVPGGRSYDRTAAERCYMTAEAAQADGYRAAKA
jgi:hypothetical protein